MTGYVLRVVADDMETDADDATRSAALEAVGELFREICRNVVRAELRLQGDVPEGLVSRVGIDGDGALARDSRRFMDGTLDYLGGSARGTWMSDTFPDIMGRKRIAARVLALADALDGASLLHGPEDDVRAFSGVDRLWVSGMAGALVRAHDGGIMGVVVKDPKRRDHWAITSGGEPVPMGFTSGISRYDQEDFSKAGPVIAVGTVVRDEDGRVVELRAVENCYTFPGAVFLRGISEDGDVGLVSPLEGLPDYYARTGTWYLRNPDLGLEASAPTWDACSLEFHRMFVELWRSHAEGRSDGNPRIRGLLAEMCPFPE